MPNITNINGLPLSSLSAIDGIDRASIASVDGITLTPPVTTYDLNVFLVAGQSNSDGRVNYSLGPAYLQDGIVDGVAAYNGNRIVYDLRQASVDTNGRASQADNNYAFNHVALYQIAQDLPNVTAVQITVGGTMLYKGPSPYTPRGSWNADYDSIVSDETALLKALEQRVTYLKNWASSRPNLSLNFRGLIWHQGEYDNFSPANSEYLANWTALVAKVRTMTNSPTLPIFYGTIPATSTYYDPLVRAAQLDFADSDANAYCRDNNDLTFFDGVHFDAASCNTFGDWVYTTYSAL